MNMLRFVGCVVALLTGLSSAKADDKVLVAGDPPLTPDLLIRLEQCLEASLGVALRVPQREECSELLVKRWKDADQDERKRMLRLADEYAEIAAQKSAGEKAGAQFQTDLLAGLRKENDALSRLLIRAHDAARKVVVPANPKGKPRNNERLEPLTQGMVDAYMQLAESVLDFTLTERQRKEFQQALIFEWRKEQNDDWHGHWLKRVKKNLASWNDARCRTGAERDAAVAQFRTEWLPVLREWANAKKFLHGQADPSSPSDRLLLSFYKAACEPGGSRNPVLVAGQPPLTQIFLERRLQFAQWVLELPLNRDQWDKYQQLLIEDWKQWPQAKKQDLLRGTEAWGRVSDYSVPYQRGQNIKDIEGWWLYFPAFTPYFRNSYRLSLKRHVLEAWGDDKAGAGDRFLAALHRTTFEPGAERNPILVEGKSALTQTVVDRYADHLEVLLDNSIVGGFTTTQRQALKDLLIKDWKKMDGDARKAFLDTVGEWDRRQEMKLVDERFNLLKEQRAALLVQLELARDHERSRWLLKVRKDGMDLYDSKLRAIRSEYDVNMAIIRNIAPSGHYEYNGATGRYDRYVPNR